MTESSGILNYTGPVDYIKIDLLLNDLKGSKEFNNIDKETGRKVYAIVVECLENIVKYSAKESACQQNIKPAIFVRREDDKIIIKAGNPIEADKTGGIVFDINTINSLDDSALNVMLETRINKTREKDDKGAGLGLILMKLKSGNNIAVRITRLDENYNYLELTISVNDYIV